MKLLLVITAVLLSGIAFGQQTLKVDLRPLSVPVKDFGKKEFKAQAFALTSAIEMTANKNGSPITLDAQAVYKANGESEMKKQITRFEYNNGSINMEISKYSSSIKPEYILKQLDKNNPVILTFKNPPYDLIKCTQTVVASKKTKSDYFGVLVLGYTTDVEPMLLVQNAAGSDCGENGFQYMPLSMCSDIKKIGCEMFVLEQLYTTVIVTPVPTVVPTEAK